MQRRAALVNAAVRAGVRSAGVLAALRETPRARYVPPEAVSRAYVDEPVPIPHRQVTSQPSLIALMVDALRLTGSERVLEVGGGHGFQTALLARLARYVWSIERWPDLAAQARANLAADRIHNVAVLAGDGSGGLPDHAPFDAIVVSAVFPEVPAPLAEELAPGGRLVQPIGVGEVDQVILFEMNEHGLLAARRRIRYARFVRLVGRYGFASQRATGAP
jgi:protein-L-isoaspartate(D-aspartate) O-methyltransferase